ncbi:MAG TPA: nitrilase-related carbon-nitrogen hydrolase [Steroidobacteraceae bacterium]|jgi:apolipoprotein N-acyltransferase|nr:nitrilase-related carbon-nitrogen hydrolase [Steroidobacteraceae bacterium]
MNRKELIYVPAAMAIGGGLWFVMGMKPVWWLAWFLPGLLFAIALRTEAWTSRGLVALAALIGASSYLGYFIKMMPLLPTLLVLLLLALIWVAVIGAARRIVKTWEAAWTVLALPVVSVALDTLLAHFTPDGNFGSLAYTQMEVLPVAQFAALFGVGGILFLLMLANSALAFAIHYGLKLRGAPIVYGGTLLVIVLAMGYGTWRLQAQPDGPSVSFGIASVDDYIGSPRTPESRDVWTQYEAQVQELAGSGAKIILLPEKISVLAVPDAEVRQKWLADLARKNHVWLVAGLGVDDGKQRRNEAWWFSPEGRRVTNYLKHFMAPPEREFVPGNEFPVNDIAGVRYGVAICKDMHFASLGRGFGRRSARVMLVPSWDFDDDAWLMANVTKLRGIENGYLVVRSSRNGLLSISDSFGRMLAVERSAKLPGTTLFATVNVPEQQETLYTRIGDALGWACVITALLMTALAFRHARRARILAELNA